MDDALKRRAYVKLARHTEHTSNTDNTDNTWQIVMPKQTSFIWERVSFGFKYLVLICWAVQLCIIVEKKIYQNIFLKAA